MTAETFVALRSNADLVAAVPYLLGFHPTDSLVIVALAGDRVPFAARFDLPAETGAAETGPAETGPAAVDHVAAVVARQDVPSVAVIGYGPPERVTQAVEVLAAALTAHGVTVHDRLRVTDGRYWSYTCRNLACCPAEGRPFDPAASPIAAATTYAGQVTYADRAGLAAQLDPVTGTAAAELVRATTTAVQRVDTLLENAADPFRALHRAGRSAVRTALRRYRSGRVLTDDEVAWLGLLLVHLPTRDHAWERVDDSGWQVDLWTDVLRRVQPLYAPAPACLLAFAAWRRGHGALAAVAVERALAVDPEYSMATLLDEILRLGIPASTLDEWVSRD